MPPEKIANELRALRQAQSLRKLGAAQDPVGVDESRRSFLKPCRHHHLITWRSVSWKSPNRSFRDRARQPGPMDGWLHLLSVVPDLQAKLRERASEQSEERILSILDVMIEVDPFEPIEAKIDARNAELRAGFLKDVPDLLDWLATVREMPTRAFRIPARADHCRRILFSMGTCRKYVRNSQVRANSKLGTAASPCSRLFRP